MTEFTNRSRCGVERWADAAKKRLKRQVYVVARPLEMGISSISETKLALCHWALLVEKFGHSEVNLNEKNNQRNALRGTLFELHRTPENKNTYNKIEDFCLEDWKEWSFILIREVGKTELSDEMLSNEGNNVNLNRCSDRHSYKYHSITSRLPRVH